MSLQFAFPPNLTTDKFIAQLSVKTALQQVSKQYALKTFYDSFDWRLYNQGLSGEFTRSKSGSTFTLKQIEQDLALASTELKEVPAFSQDFQDATLRNLMSPFLEMRALLPIITLDYDIYHLNVINDDEKTVLRLQVENHELLDNLVTLFPLKGYDKAAEQIAAWFLDMGLSPNPKPLLVNALTLHGRKPNDYCSKISINLAPDMRADIAAKYIYSHLLQAIKVNEQGTIADTDSEFLHDFRVAVRRTRAGLSQLKGVLPDETTAYFAEFFSWLGQITGPTRDLDVYLLNFSRFKNSLPIAIRDDLDPLYDFLQHKQHHAQQELAKKLRTPKYLNSLSEWEDYLKAQAPFMTTQAHGKLNIKQLADHRLWKNYRRVLKEGSAITDSSPAEALHELRKSCKKLRYLLEFFQSLYDEAAIKQFIKNLKGLQEVLGNFQDCSVQEDTLKQFSEQMLNEHVHANTLMAMGVLIQNLDTLKHTMRSEFFSKFATFKHEDNHAAFKALLVTHG